MLKPTLLFALLALPAPTPALACAPALPAAVAAAYDPTVIAAAIAVIKNAPDLINQAIDWKQNLERLVKGGLWPRWFVKYADGTVVYNRFRFYRTPKVVIEYFTGRSPSPDRDAYMVVRGNNVHIYYDRNGAREMVRKHGKIVDFGCRN